MLLLISFSSAICSDSQININSASLDELDSLTGIGPVYAQRIIDGRPYASVDELDKVNGIGPATLEKIRSQGLACVSEKEAETSSDLKEIVTEISKNEEVTISAQDSQIIEETSDKFSTENIINLNSEATLSKSDQKEEVIFESKNEKVKRYLIFAFAFFLILMIIFLLLTK